MTTRQKITTWLTCILGMLVVISALSTDPFVFWPVMGRLALFSLIVGAIYAVLITIGVTVLAKFGLADPEISAWPHIKKGFKKLASLAQRLRL